MRDIAPKAVIKAKGLVGWPRNFKAERVALCLLDLAESGHLDVPPPKLSDFLKAKGYPQLAWAVRTQLEANHLNRLLDLDKDDAFGKRQLVKDIVNGR